VAAASSAKSYSVNSELLSSIRHSFSASSVVELFRDCASSCSFLFFFSALEVFFPPAS
jgi:hypothetical protein